MEFGIVVAADEKMGIGKDNHLPWPRLAGDMKYFSDVTTECGQGKMNAVIMGRKTWDSIPEARRPLKNRLNIVMSRGDIDLPDGVELVHSFEDALKLADERQDVDKIFVIGGANVFEQSLRHEFLKTIYLTEVLGTFECDTFLAEIPSYFERISESEEQEDQGVRYRFVVLKRD